MWILIIFIIALIATGFIMGPFAFRATNGFAFLVDIIVFIIIFVSLLRVSNFLSHIF